MINEILAYFAPGLFEVLIVIVVSLLVFGIPAVLIFLFIRFIIQTKRERLKLRLEVGKLADELQQVKEQMETKDKDRNKD